MPYNQLECWKTDLFNNAIDSQKEYDDLMYKKQMEAYGKKVWLNTNKCYWY